jgi:anti-sigma factor RsiW
MHLSDGEIKAYIDQETGADEVQRTEKHLATCSRCQERQRATVCTRASRKRS